MPRTAETSWANSWARETAPRRFFAFTNLPASPANEKADGGMRTLDLSFTRSHFRQTAASRGSGVAFPNVLEARLPAVGRRGADLDVADALSNDARLAVFSSLDWMY